MPEPIANNGVTFSCEDGRVRAVGRVEDIYPQFALEFPIAPGRYKLVGCGRRGKPFVRINLGYDEAEHRVVYVPIGDGSTEVDEAEFSIERTYPGGQKFEVLLSPDFFPIGSEVDCHTDLVLTYA